MPSIAKAEPLGLNLISSEGFPSKSTYWVAIWPFAASSLRRASSARSLPSPWETGTVNTSPTSVPASHGDLSEAILTRTSLDWCLPISLRVRVGHVSSVSMILPKGTSPSFISAWNPLQIPHMRPPLLSIRSVTASLTAGFLKKAVINLPEPSGSSPPEKPPGMNTIWESLRAPAKASTDPAIASAVMFLITII